MQEVTASAARPVSLLPGEVVRAMVSSAAWLFGVTVLAALVLRQWLGDDLMLTRYAGYGMPWLLLGLVPGSIWAWATRSRALAGVLGVSAVVILVLHLPLFRPRPSLAASTRTLGVMSYNTWSRNGDARRIANVVLGQAPDVLLLQEIRPEVFERVLAGLRDLYDGAPVHSAYEPAIQQAVVSRYPLEASTAMAQKGKAQRVVVQLPDGPITIFNVHPALNGGWRQRHRQIAALVEEDVVRETNPVILGGDFNAPEHSQLYAAVTRRLENAHRAAGFGFGFTFPSSERRWFGLGSVPSLVRIDHLFFSDDFVALRAGTMEDSGGSDHRPVFAELELKSRTPDVTGRRPAHDARSPTVRPGDGGESCTARRKAWRGAATCA